MTEIILGVGEQKSLRNVLYAAEMELHRTHGPPRKVQLRGGGVELAAARPQFDGPFVAFVARFRLQGELLDQLKAIAARYPESCSVVEAENAQEFHCKAVSAEDVSQTLDELSDLIRLPEVWHIEGADFHTGALSVENLFREMVQFHASDVHLYPGAPPAFRVDNEIRHAEADLVSADQVLELVQRTAPAKTWQEFERAGQCSYGYHQFGVGYSRCSAFMKSGVPHCTFRFLPETIPTFEDLRLPATTMETLGRLPLGLVLVAGMTGSGKSTTVASLVDWINSNRQLHIVTIEDPVEYVFVNKHSIVSQRQVGVDVQNFELAVRGSLRHDPDVIFIGEMRDKETIRAAIAAAATGHLVISTLHSNTAAEVPNRIVSFFDPVERDLVRLQLRDAIRCVICQRLLRKKGGGRIPAFELLFNDIKHIGDCILSGDTLGIRNGMQQTLSQSMLFEQSLMELWKAKLVSLEDAQACATSPDTFEQMRLGTYRPPPLESSRQTGLGSIA